MTPLTKPLYEHDCSQEHGCTFLGSMRVTQEMVDYAGESVEAVDLWIHHTGTDYGRSLIYRCSSEGSDYLSVPFDLLDESGQARMRANPFYAEILTRASK